MIIGQKNIHDRIQQLGFRDCHAKISYVDAQATLGDGVVVQVSGELSNDGHPMRRFTQTFVLACQSPKKYYVHNDIFRYQDVLNEDDESGEGQDLNSDTVTVSDGSSGIITTPTNQNVYYPPPASVVSNPPGIVNYVTQPMNVSPAGPPQQINGGVMMHDEMLKSISTQTSHTPVLIQNAQVPVIPQIPMAPAPAALPLPIEPVAVVSPETVQMIPTAPINDIKDQYDAEVSTGDDTESLDNSKDDQIVDEPGKIINFSCYISCDLFRFSVF